MKNSVIEEQVENQVITLDQVEVRNLPELQGWKEKQLSIVNENPFVSIEDYKSYEEAKKHRTALVTARTTIQNQDKLIAKKLKELRSEAGQIAEELIAITQPHEEKQQEEVKRYEAEKEAERLEKEKIEQERKIAIQNDINDFYQNWKNEIKNMDHYTDIENLKVVMEARIVSQSEKEMEEFEMDFAEKVNLLRSQLQERIQYLTEKEEARKESDRLAAERAELEKMRKESEAREAKERAAREAEEKERQAKRQAEELELKKQREELEAQRNQLADQEAKRQAAIEAERKAKEDAAAKAAAEAEAKARKEAELKRLEELKPDKEKATTYFESFKFQNDFPEFQDPFVEEIFESLIQSHKEWIANAQQTIQNLK